MGMKYWAFGFTQIIYENLVTQLKILKFHIYLFHVRNDWLKTTSQAFAVLSKDRHLPPGVPEKDEQRGGR